MFKAAVIGLGAVAPMHLKSLEATGVKLAAVCDKNILTGFDCPVFSDYKKMLAAGGFDVLHICLPHFLHAEVAVAALERGIHVLCEKPPATTVADAEKMHEAAKKHDAFLSVVFQNRFSPGAILIKKNLHALGAVKSGFLRVNWNRGDDYYSSGDWRGKLATEGGGVLINQSIHTFDLVNFFLGDFCEISAAIANRAHPKIEVEDVAEGIITYKNGAKISFFVNTYHPYDAPATIELICENGRAQIIGEDATIFFSDGQKITAGADVDAQRRFGMKSYWGVSHVKQIQAFYDAITAGIAPQPDGAEWLRTQRLINGIYDAARCV
ncbi:MAG: Gfo/Idh/MocA family oxidoreductase [Defluviitaleaceae bacterium]|nr:Gfo/Idh/MocA family oxidoreductase [Defluviitaleaceae bacterium]